MSFRLKLKLPGRIPRIASQNQPQEPVGQREPLTITREGEPRGASLLLRRQQRSKGRMVRLMPGQVAEPDMHVLPRET